MEKLSKNYIDFLNVGKTERECTDEIIRQGKKNDLSLLKKQ